MSGQRPRLLALCGARCNTEVMRLQLSNLRIGDRACDVSYLHGAIEVEEENTELSDTFRGPFYSWLSTENGHRLNESLLDAVRLVLEHVRQEGPFDGVFGFSQGGLVASLVSGIADDPVLQENLQQRTVGLGHWTQYLRSLGLTQDGQVSEQRLNEIFDAMDSSGTGRIALGDLDKSVRGAGMRVTSRDLTAMVSTATSALDSSDRAREGVDRTGFHALSRTALAQTPVSQGSASRDADAVREAITDPPFKFAVVCCAALSLDGSMVLSAIKCSSRKFICRPEGQLIGVKSFHIVGIDDEGKAQSEDVASLFKGGTVMYKAGGHEVGRELRSDKQLWFSLRHFIKSNGHLEEVPMASEFKPVSDVSSLALHPANQVALVQLRDKGLPTKILDCLEARPRDALFLYNARDPTGPSTSYGQALDFIRGGGGDLRRIGVRRGEVVCYVTPLGASAVGALAFLAVGAQTTAAPLAPMTTEPDARTALNQLHAKHLLLFEGVECPGVVAAFKKHNRGRRVRGVCHTARIVDAVPGTFEFTSRQDPDFASRPVLANPEDGQCLLLRTSGTTARPKVVPLHQDALVTNAAVVAASLQLTPHDACYSVMPLFHIGGLSASVLCTLVSGGSLCCEKEPYDAGRMVEALAASRPQPTWYSAVPTIHTATVAFLRDHARADPRFAGYAIEGGGVWAKGHGLRLIRSGAAALSPADAEALSAAYGGVPVCPTYSMSEQMPIAQPIAGKLDMITDKPGSVGVPVAASLAIVSRTRYRPLSYGIEGEVAISGPTVMRGYLDNPEADSRSFFFLTLPDDGNHDRTLDNCRYFLTGDVGVLDRDGHLTLKGRAKELIKKGGEQVSPQEVEDVLTRHPWVNIALCVAVPSHVYGEEVGCALVLSDEAPGEARTDTSVVIKTMRRWLKEQQLALHKWPTKWTLVEETALPRTATKKLVRVNTAARLGLLEEEEEECEVVAATNQTKAFVDWDVVTGFRFFLACYVMFMHIGANDSWGPMNNLRGWPWHVHCFFTLAGFSMASPMNPEITRKFSYFKSRIGHIYPMYMMSLFFCFVNLLVVCRPSTFRKDFHWDAQPDDQDSGLFCEGTPMFKSSYYGSLVATILVYLFGIAVTPFWELSWWMGYYLWFSSIYYQCLAFSPTVYNYLLRSSRKRTGFILKIMFLLQAANALMLYLAWLLLSGRKGYNHYNAETGEPNDPRLYSNGAPYNTAMLSFYLFGPFWVIYFAIGMVIAFLYDSVKPGERHNARIYSLFSLKGGWIADGCTIVILSIGIVVVCQGGYSQKKYFRPSQADEYTDEAITSRLWDNICGRIMCPVTSLWIFALSTGKGYTASILRNDFLVNYLGPNSYGCFLFHQVVCQWYYAATRNGAWWNWWNYRKSFYWFSPQPCPVEWYEYFYLVGIVVAFSQLVEHTLLPAISKVFRFLDRRRGAEEDVDVTQTLFKIIEGVTGIEPEIESTLDEVGLASVGLPVIVRMLNDAFTKKHVPCDITHQDLIQANTLADIVAVVENAKSRMRHDGI